MTRKEVTRPRPTAAQRREAEVWYAAAGKCLLGARAGLALVSGHLSHWDYESLRADLETSGYSFDASTEEAATHCLLLAAASLDP